MKLAWRKNGNVEIDHQIHTRVGLIEPKQGEKVIHASLGKGTISSIEQDGDLMIRFDGRPKDYIMNCTYLERIVL